MAGTAENERTGNSPEIPPLQFTHRGKFDMFIGDNLLRRCYDISGNIHHPYAYIVLPQDFQPGPAISLASPSHWQAKYRR